MVQRRNFNAPTGAVALLAAAAILSSGSASGIFVNASTRSVAAFGLDRRQALQRASSAIVGGLTFVGKTAPGFADEDDNAPLLAQESSPTGVSASTLTTSTITASAPTSQVSEETTPYLETGHNDISDSMQDSPAKVEEAANTKEMIETTPVAEGESEAGGVRVEIENQEDRVADETERTRVSETAVSIEAHATVSAETEQSSVAEEKSSKTTVETLEVAETTRAPKATTLAEEMPTPAQSETPDSIVDEKGPELVARSETGADTIDAVGTPVSVASQERSMSESITDLQVSFDEVCVADEQKIFALN